MLPGFRKQLVEWYSRNARDLPWRGKRPGPYRVWVSEIMLQQTRVEAVRDHFSRFIKRFPNIASLAKADPEHVLEAWSGLGYYRRARMMHAAAKQIVGLHNGRFPKTREAVLALPGVGRYTAGAVLSIAFGQPEPIVDGNIERVFARLQRIDEPVKLRGGKRIWECALGHIRQGILEGHEPSDLNQALMELGATVCTPLSPDCRNCPVRRHCAARRHGDQARYPVLPLRAKAKARRYLFLALGDDAGRVLLVRRAPGDRQSLLPGGMWELPHLEWKACKRKPVAALAESLGAGITTTGRPVTRAHAIMNYKLSLVVQAVRPQAGIQETPDRRWFMPAQAENAAIASATRKLLEAIREI